MSDHSSSAQKTYHLKHGLEDGAANLDSDSSTRSSQNLPPRSLKIALQEAAQNAGDSAESTPDSEEDYDKLKLDPLTVIHGGRGGGFENGATPDSDDEVVKVLEQLKAAPKVGISRRPTNLRLKSIPYPGKKGKYFVVADDEEIKKILKMELERVIVNPPVSISCANQDFRRKILNRQSGGKSLVTWSSRASSQLLTDKMQRVQNRLSMAFLPCFGSELQSSYCS